MSNRLHKTRKTNKVKQAVIPIKSRLRATIYFALTLATILSTGYYYYRNHLVQPLMIANIENDYDTRSKCQGTCDNGRLLKWSGGRCRDSGKPCGGNSTPPPSSNACTYDGKNPNGVYCGGCVNRCILYSELGNQGCNEYVSAKCGTPIIYGASCTTDQTIATKNGWIKSCSCGPKITAWYDREGSCTASDGLCAIVNNGACNNGIVGGNNPTGDAWKCNESGCEITNNNSKSCFVEKYTCDTMPPNQACLDQPSGGANNQRFDASDSYCGKVQQIDVVCNNAYRESRTKIFPGCGPKPPSSSLPTPTVTPKSTPTPTPTPIAACQQVLAYSSSWQLLSQTDFVDFIAGSQLYLCVSGNSNVGTFTKAQFTVNTTLRPEVTLVKPGNPNTLCDLYTIPANIYEYKIKATIYNSVLGWR